MDDGFGARLRRQRERRQIALESIAAETKVSLSLLEGLERDDVSRWPVGIFRRAFVRAYAHSIGLDPDSVIREFLERHPDAADVIPTLAPAEPANGHESTRPNPPTRLQCFLRSVAEALPYRRRRVEALELAPARDTSRVRSDGTHAVEHEASAWPDLSTAADLCTRLGRVHRADQVTPLLEEAAGILDAIGLVVWSWDLAAGALNPTLAFGYSDAVLAQMANIRPDADHAVAAAFRTREPQIVAGSCLATGAVVLPLVTATGCVGVLALELQRGGEQRETVRAFATVLAALLAILIGAGRWLTRSPAHAVRSMTATAERSVRSAAAM